MGDPNKDLESGGGDSAPFLHPNLDELGSSPGTMNLSQLQSLLRPIPPSDPPPTWLTSAPAINPPRVVNITGASTFGFGGNILASQPTAANDSPPTGFTFAPAINSSQAPQPYITSNGFRFGFGGNTLTPQPPPATSSSLHIPSKPHPQMTYLPRDSPEHESGDRGPFSFSSQPVTFGANAKHPSTEIEILRAEINKLKSHLRQPTSVSLSPFNISSATPPPYQAGFPEGSGYTCNAFAVDFPKPVNLTSDLFRSKVSASSKLNIHRALGTCFPYRGTYGGIESIQPNNWRPVGETKVVYKSTAFMLEYANKSFEELRWEDYQLVMDKRPQVYTSDPKPAAPSCNGIKTYCTKGRIASRSTPTWASIGKEESVSADKGKAERRRLKEEREKGLTPLPPLPPLPSPVASSHHIWDLLPKSQFVSADKDREELRRLKEDRERALNPPQPQITQVILNFPRRLTLSFIALNIVVFLIVILIAVYIWIHRTN